MTLAQSCVPHLDKLVKDWRTTLPKTRNLTPDMTKVVKAVAIETDVVFFEYSDVADELLNILETEV